MNTSTQTATYTDSFDLIIKWLGGRDKAKIEKATSILVSIGQPVVKYLVREAIKPRKQPEHRIAILDTVQQIGGPFGVDEIFALRSLLQHHNPSVRCKAEEVIMAASPCGLPKSTKGVALMRAFNPFLAPPPGRCPPRRTRLTDFAAALRGDQAAMRRRARSSAARQETAEQGRRS